MRAYAPLEGAKNQLLLAALALRPPGLGLLECWRSSIEMQDSCAEHAGRPFQKHQIHWFGARDIGSVQAIFEGRQEKKRDIALDQRLTETHHS